MTLGLVVPDAGATFFGSLAREIENAAFSAGYTLLLGNAMERAERESAHVRALLDRQVDGLILAPIGRSGPWVDEVARSRTRTVILDRELEDVSATQILIDNEQGAYDATRHLIEHGWRRVGCLAGPEGVHPTIDRVAGWRRALAEAGIDPAGTPPSYGSFRQWDGYEQGKRLLAGSARPDAIFTTSDEQGLGLLRAAFERGLRVPRDLAVVSFDGIAGSAYSIPSLSTVQQPLDELGALAVQRVLAQSADERPDGETIRLTTKLIVRESCGCGREAAPRA
ncbi:MAG: LacI family transcriptional regulator [Actinobacteria bacterium 13_2_20CM_2_71_6]|nr:MAG: LacI family transcriptional regulator [Actinobacteria bacterium 13_2_20CM_2_71_6]